MDKFYSMYYMITPRCILNCKYCFRDTSPESIRSELDVEDVKKVITHLYKNLNIRKLTISGGEPTIVGGVTNTKFLEIIKHIKQFKSSNKEDNLRVELLSNAVNLTEDVVVQLKGIVDRITITLDTIDEDTLTKLGRNTNVYKNYLSRFVDRFKLFSKHGFDVKIHSVITPVNYEGLSDLVKYIMSFENEVSISRWKFYQYMTYGIEETDRIFSISDELYNKAKENILEIGENSKIDFTFKDNQLMAESMINLLHSGKLESYHEEDDKIIKNISNNILEYNSMDELLESNKIDKDKFFIYHGIQYNG